MDRRRRGTRIRPAAGDRDHADRLSPVRSRRTGRALLRRRASGVALGAVPGNDGATGGGTDPGAAGRGTAAVAEAASTAPAGAQPRTGVVARLSIASFAPRFGKHMPPAGAHAGGLVLGQADRAHGAD